MRKVVIFPILLFLLLHQGGAANNPKSVIQAKIKKEFPAAKNIMVLHLNREYKVQFIYNGQRVKIVYDEALREILRETAIPEKELPRLIKNKIGKKFPEGVILSAKKIKKENKIFYKILLESGDYQYTLHYLPSGKMIKLSKQVVEAEPDMGC